MTQLQEPPSSPSVAETDTCPASPRSVVSRRGLLGALGAGVVGLGVGAASGILDARETEPSRQRTADQTYSFYGARQAGITTPVQDRLHFAVFDVTTESRDELITLLQDWTAAAARMTQGQGVGQFGPAGGPYLAPPDDTGEALGLAPSGLTVTFGFGPTLFRRAGVARFGLGDRQPEALRRLPHFAGDRLDVARSDGDVCVQACADDPQVAVHAVRNLTRIAFGRAAIRWSQLGFGRTSTVWPSRVTPRNLFGFKDGTANLKAEQPTLLDDHVWVKAGDPRGDWLVGGSYLVVRRINMRIEIWDRQSLAEQERVIGRSKAGGAPLSGGTEFSAPDFTMKGSDRQPLIDAGAHVRLAHPDSNGGVQMLRRGYNFVDGSDGLGRLDAGLFFLAYVCNPRTHYIPIQIKLARADGLSEYLRHTGSTLFAVPPGVVPGQFIGHALFA